MGPHYEIDGDSLCIRIPLDAIAEQAMAQADGMLKVKDKTALALAMGRELCECEDHGEDIFINSTLDAAIVRVIESADPSLEFPDDD